MASACLILQRGISTTCVSYGKRNFRKFNLYNKRGNKAFREARIKDPNFPLPADPRGTRPTGFWEESRWVHVPEMVPELIVPSLKDFHLKPYVSYRVNEPEAGTRFTAQHLFDAVYVPKIKKDFINNALGPNGEPLHPSENEQLTPTEARARAEKTGTDIFTES